MQVDDAPVSAHIAAAAAAVEAGVRVVPVAIVLAATQLSVDKARAVLRKHPVIAVALQHLHG